MAKRNATTVRNPEFTGDKVGRPDDERDLARGNFQPVIRRPSPPQRSGRRPSFTGIRGKPALRRYWEKVFTESQ